MYTHTELLGKKKRILENFPFDKVHAYMLLTKWQWVNVLDNSYYTPTIEQLKVHAERVIDLIAFDDKPVSSGGNGGFTCYKFAYGIKLSFEPFYDASF